MNKLETFKKSFSKNNHIHLNNGGLSPISKEARDQIIYWSNRFYEDGFYADNDYMNDVLSARTNLSKLIGCKKEEIAFFQSTAGAISQMAFEFPLKKDDEIIMWEEEYGSNLYPWQEKATRVGAKLILIPSQKNLATPSESIVNHVTDKTKVIAISWVQFLTGAKTDIKKLKMELDQKKKDHNIFIFLDIIQGLGLFEFNMKELGVDAVAGGSHKWLYSPVGVGYLALDSKYHGLIKPHNYGSSTFGTCDDPTSLVCMPKSDALKYEPGSKQVLEITALGKSVELILETGVSVIGTETLRLAKMLREGLESLGYEISSPYEVQNHDSAFVNFIPKSKTIELLKSIPCNFAIRGPGVRLSPAAHNNDSEIKIVLEKLKEDK